MSRYQKPQPELWSGRLSKNTLYLHEKVAFLDLEKDDLSQTPPNNFVLLDYACDEGVKRNQGRIGAKKGGETFKKVFGKLPNHLPTNTLLFDGGTISCNDTNLEATQNELAVRIEQLLNHKQFPIVIGGGHDIAYGHYHGIKKHVGNKTVGVINFDAHFDLRNNINTNNSGTPFYQIAKESETQNIPFNYMCLGIRKDANDKTLFKTAKENDVVVIENKMFSMHYLQYIKNTLNHFLDLVDYVYVTIDLDGFSSAYAPGVSAPNPVGFAPDVVFESLEHIINSNKLISLDLAEFNPKYDIDNQTAKLACSLVHFVIDKANTY